MPSPVGHALGAVAAGFAGADIAPSSSLGHTRYPWHEAALFSTIGLLPDLDLLVGAHSQYTHSVGAVAVVLAVAWLATRGRSFRLALAIALAYASHPLLDWLGQDGTPPYGVMLLWPFDPGFHHSGLDLFTGISRQYLAARLLRSQPGGGGPGGRHPRPAGPRRLAGPAASRLMRDAGPACLVEGPVAESAQPRV